MGKDFTMKPEVIAEIQRLISLQKEQEKKDLTNEAKFLALIEKYKEYENLNSVQMQKKLTEAMKPKVFKTQGEDNELLLMLKDFKNKFGKGKEFKEPQINNHTVILEFPSPKEAKEFFLEQAQKNRSFKVFDPDTNNVIAYSNGDGKLYHGDGKVFNPGESLSPSKVEDDNHHHQSSSSPSKRI